MYWGSRRRRRFWWLALALNLVVVGCSPRQDEIYLPALLADPMASYAAAGIELVRQDTQPYGQGPMLWDAYPPEVVSDYSIAVGYSPESVAKSAADWAKEAGWGVAIDGSVPNKYVGMKDLGVGTGLLIILVIPADGEHESRLRVYLEFSAL